MRHRRLISLAATFAVAASCSSNDAASGGGSSHSVSSDSTVHATSVPWFGGVEPLLLVPAHSNDRALVALADSLAPDMEDGTLSLPGSLVRLDGSIETVRVSLSSDTEGCVDASLLPAPAVTWGVGFVGAAPRTVRVDSLGSISRNDSASLAATVFRLASGVPNAPGGRFKGLPFSLVDLWRLRAADGSTIIVATTKRQINQEDSPLEERTLIIAEADSSGSFAIFHSDRSTGAEETVEGSELLGAVSFADKPALELVFAHDFGEEGAYSVIERAARGQWKIRWVSRRFSC